MAEEFLHRLKTPRERDFELFLATQVVERIGFRAWEQYQIAQHTALMSLYDDFTYFLEQQVNRPNLTAELEARRLLTVELRIQFADFVTSVFNMTAANIVQQVQNGDNNN